MATVTFREYSQLGEFIGNISALHFGRIPAGAHSRVKIIDIAFTGVEEVSNVKLGLTNDGGLQANPSPTELQSDGSASNGKFGIRHTEGFSTQIAPGPLGRHFAGVNSSLEASDDKNILVGTRNHNTSQFIYLDIEAPSNNNGTGGLMYKVFFDFV
jgi:hypothetical protein